VSISELSHKINVLQVDTILSIEICYDLQKQKNVSVVDIQGDVLFIPQASLVGKLKGTKLQ
jgi:D-Tyr-tRNAtyr deacylase